MVITIKKIRHEQKIGKSGKSFESCKIQTINSKGEEVWLSGFGSEITHSWQAEDKVEVDLAQNEKGYWNFKENKNTLPSPDKKFQLLLEINNKLDVLLHCGVKNPPNNNEEISDNEIPF
jgi:hypothetical protein